jgi:hypothetical protein
MAFMRPELCQPTAGFLSMKTPSQYREFAEDCLRLAKNAKREDERKVLQQMAETWLKLADEADQIGSDKSG